MSVLARELDSYQRALTAYRRDAAKYNKLADAHNEKARAYTDSLVRSENGDAYVVSVNRSGTVGTPTVMGVYTAGEDGMLTKAVLPGDPKNYDLTPATPGDDRFMLLRKRSDQTQIETIGGLQRVEDERGGSNYFLQGPGTAPAENIWGDDDPTRSKLNATGFGQDWQVRVDEPGSVRNRLSQSIMNPGAPQTYTASREVSVLPESPGEWDREFLQARPEQPDPTLSALRRMGRPSPAMAEAGLIGQAIRGRGVR